MKKVLFKMSMVIILLSFTFCKKEKKEISMNVIEENVSFIKESMDWNNKRAAIVNNGNSKNIGSGEIESIKQYLRNAIDAASKVDTIVLNSVRNNYGHIYYFKYLKGMELELEGIEKGDNKKSINGQIMYDEFVDWITKEGL